MSPASAGKSCSGSRRRNARRNGAFHRRRSCACLRRFCHRRLHGPY
ncbi:MAG: hypothetical protein MSS94_02085 [Clostridiales bacterium]|nr:hypothetical protein [Clostridiales bacterium]